MKPNVLFVTGAGISASAGIATYRDKNSSWVDGDLEKKSHSTRYGNHLDELWDRHWGPTQAAMATAVPTEAHKAIAAFQKDNESIVVTQNIDDLHERAGSDNVAHVHGVMNTRCMKCKQPTDIAQWTGHGAPECVRCGKNKTRPDVVLFGEQLNAKLVNGIRVFTHDVSHLIVIGTSLNVYPVAAIVQDCLGTDIKTIYISKDGSPWDRYFDEVHTGKTADEVVPGVLDSVHIERAWTP